MQRYYFLDATRAALMLLGIPFHAALLYCSQNWLLNSSESVPALTVLTQFLSTFRMPAFFVLAGFFATFLLERQDALQWLRSRVKRLGIPLLTGCIVIMPLQDLVLALAPPDAVRWPGNLGSLLLGHLWFLPILLMHCAMFAMAWKRVERIRFPDLPVWMIGFVFGAWAIALQVFETLTNYSLHLLGNLIDLDRVVFYAPFFVLGVALRRNPATFARFRRWEWSQAAVAAAALSVLGLTWREQTQLDIALALMSTNVAALCITQMLFCAMARFLDKPSDRVGKLVDASFTIYLFHHPIIIALGLGFYYLPLPPLLEWGAICAITLALTYGVHQALSRSPAMLFLFNGVSPRHRQGLVVPASALRPN